MINIFGAIKTVATIGKTIADVKKEIKKTKNALKNDIQPLQTYVNEPNENNVEIGKLKDEIIFLKNELKKQNTTIKKLKPNKKKADRKWYDE